MVNIDLPGGMGVIVEPDDIWLQRDGRIFLTDLAKCEQQLLLHLRAVPYDYTYRPRARRTALLASINQAYLNFLLNFEDREIQTEYFLRKMDKQINILLDLAERTYRNYDPLC